MPITNVGYGNFCPQQINWRLTPLQREVKVAIMIIITYIIYNNMLHFNFEVGKHLVNILKATGFFKI